MSQSPSSSSPPLGSPEAAELLRRPAELRRLLQSPETRRLIALLQRQGNLDAAARQAKAGDPSALQSMLSGLSDSPEGAQALGQMQQQLDR